jgi:hypothetical protein
VNERVCESQLASASHVNEVTVRNMIEP